MRAEELDDKKKRCFQEIAAKSGHIFMTITAELFNLNVFVVKEKSTILLLFFFSRAAPARAKL